MTVDVTSTVQKWIKGGTINGGTLNEGFAIQPIVKTGSLVASVMLTSKEGSVLGLPAELDIEFQPEGGVDKPVTLDQLPSEMRALLNPKPLTLDQLPQELNSNLSAIKNFLNPKFTKQPNLSNGSLNVGVSGVGDIIQHWSRNGVDLADDGWMAKNLLGMSGGTYSVTVSNGFGSAAASFYVPLNASLKTIPAGTYQIGNITGDIDILDAPVTTVLLSEYSIQDTTVTKVQWDEVRRWALNNGYPDIREGTSKAPNHPIVNINFYDVVKWCNAASEKEGLDPCYFVNGIVYRAGESDAVSVDWSVNGYRLPTEAEWEVAARGGLAANRFPLGDQISHEQANYRASTDYSYDSSGNTNSFHPSYSNGSEPYTSPVGSFLPNGYELHDMDGNVNQMCWDWYAGVYQSGKDPKGPMSGSVRVKRGGMWDNYAHNSRCSARVSWDPPSLGYRSLGFRFARGSEWKKFAIVKGGNLPPSSPLGAVPVDTFYIGRTEVTWGEWKTVRAWAVANGYTDLYGVGQGLGDNYPVTEVNWFDVVKWCNARSEKEGKTTVYKVQGDVYRTGEFNPEEISSSTGYRLPSEKEWEFAARGGMKSHVYTYSGSDDLDTVAWYARNSGGGAHEVGKRLANELGIFDMSGNIYEWTGSWDPVILLYRLFRGGCWDYSAEFCAVSNHNIGSYPEHRGTVGFRVATSGEYAHGITVQPSISSDGAKISARAEGAGKLTYQWMRNGLAIAGGTSSELPTDGLGSGTYTVAVSNGITNKSSIESVQYPSPVGGFVLVKSGTLPASSLLGAFSVDTFYIGKTEVTWGEWQAVRTWAVLNGYEDLANIGKPGLFTATHPTANDNKAVSNLNWYDCVKWCNAKSEKEGRTPVYKISGTVFRQGQLTPDEDFLANGFRLPNEAEWEYAARGGANAQGYAYSGSDDLDTVGWYMGNSNQAAPEVAKKHSNELGIFDMSGNVYEWTGSWHPEYLGSVRIIRGGDWHWYAEECKVGKRYMWEGFPSPTWRDGSGGMLGFRLALNFAN